MLKKQNGITLIALIVTIIVLLILAGVSIAMITGENGIATKATASKTKTAEAGEKESVSMAVATALTEGKGTIKTDESGKIVSDEVKKVLNNELKAIGYEGAEITTLPTEVEMAYNTYYIDEFGKVTTVSGKTLKLLAGSQIYNESDNTIKIELETKVIGITEEEAIEKAIEYFNTMLGGNKINSLEDLVVFAVYGDSEVEGKSYNDVLIELGMEENAKPTEVFEHLSGMSVEEMFSESYSMFARTKSLKINGEDVTNSIDWEDEDIEFMINNTNGTYEVELHLDEMVATKEIEVNNGTVIGRYVKYDANENNTIEDDILYRVLYTEDELGKELGAQIVSVELVEDSLTTLGYEDDTVDESKLTEINGDDNLNFEKAVASYNNAIETLNKKCGELEEANKVKGIVSDVRCIGTDPLNPNKDTNEYFTEEDIQNYVVGTDTWFEKYSGYIENALDNSNVINNSKDFNRISNAGLYVIENFDGYLSYWSGLKYTYYTNDTYFNRIQQSFGYYDCGNSSYNTSHILSVFSTDIIEDIDPVSHYLRPVVVLEDGVLKNATGTGSETDPLILK